MPGTSLVSVGGDGTMVRFNEGQRVAFGHSLIELANFAAAALVFGQFVGQQPPSWMVMFGGIAVWWALIGIGLKLLGGR
jgi:hypothetical protein